MKRRGAALLAAVGVCMGGCSFDAFGAGAATDSATGGGTATSGSSGAPTGSSASGPTASTASASGTSASTTDATGASASDSMSSATSASTGGATSGAGSSGTSDTGGEGLAGDDAVVVRYYLDEQASGQPGATVLDSAPAPAFDLPMIYDDGDMTPQYVEDNGQRGLHWPTNGMGGRAEGAVSGTKFMDLAGRTSCTVEVVVDMYDVFQSAEPWARIIVWQPDIVPFNVQMGLLGFWDADAVALDVRSAWQVDNQPPTGRWSLANDAGRIVVHAVFDTTLPVDDRVRLFIDGVLATPTFVNPPGQGDTLTVSDDAFLLLGNRPNDDVSFGGTLYYAAVYERALSVAEVGQNAAWLAADDDG